MRGFHIECRYKNGINLENSRIKEEIERRLGHLLSSAPSITENIAFHAYIDDEILRRALEEVFIAESTLRGFIFHHYQFIVENQDSCKKLPITENTDDDDLFLATKLPNESESHSWESLYFDSDVKERLLSYAGSLMLSSHNGLNMQIFDLHRILLLQGPPGCGKTSLSKALAQKLAIRSGSLLGRQCDMRLIQVNCQSLFSKWFSESSKKIMSLFEEIRRLAAIPNVFVCILIGIQMCIFLIPSLYALLDEIESITMSRSSLFQGNEPSDSIRAVNVLLTQIDQLKSLSNYIILSTSNLLHTVDPAFRDRVDIEFHLDQPGVRAKYEILKAGIQELEEKGLIKKIVCQEESDIKLMKLIKSSLALNSGRSLRKLPFLTLTQCSLQFDCPIDADQFVDTMEKLSDHPNTADDISR